MLFPTTGFAVFFLIVWMGGWVLNRRRRAWALFMLAASYVFYGWWDWRFLGLIAGCTVVNHAAACLIARSGRIRIRQGVLAAALIVDLGILGMFKYAGFFIMTAYGVCGRLGIPCSLPLLDIVLPVGISFFTFQAMSYVMDVYRQDRAPAGSLLDFAVYLAFFPQLVAGPIVRATVFLPQLKRPARLADVNIGQAAGLILGGLLKKMVLADRLASRLADPVFLDPDLCSAPDVILGIYGYALQIYCDFSAYSDIAIGAALLLGIHFPMNFNAPYCATSMRDFWRRWHISLSTWLRDYLYIPMGGSRKGPIATGRNLLVTFLLGGLWHGANWRFVVWGGLHGLYLVIERVWRFWIPARTDSPPSGRARRAIARLASTMLVFHAVCFSWLFFRAETFEDAWILLGRMSDWSSSRFLDYPTVFLLMSGFAVQALDGNRMMPVWNRFNRLNFVLQGLLAAVILTVILALAPSGVAPFIYFQF